MKPCHHCGETKPLADFPPRKGVRDGRFGYCYTCRTVINREKMRKWRAANPERARRKANAASRKFREANPGYHRDWYQRNIDKERTRLRDDMRRWRAEHPDEARARRQRYRAKHLSAVQERERENTYARRARQPYSADLAQLMTELVAQPCAYCGATEDITIDHVVPLARGGAHVASNLAPSCLACNASKCDRLLSEWPGRLGVSGSSTR